MIVIFILLLLITYLSCEYNTYSSLSEIEIFIFVLTENSSSMIHLFLQKKVYDSLKFIR